MASSQFPAPGNGTFLGVEDEESFWPDVPLSVLILVVPILLFPAYFAFFGAPCKCCTSYQKNPNLKEDTIILKLGFCCVILGLLFALIAVMLETRAESTSAESVLADSGRGTRNITLAGGFTDTELKYTMAMFVSLMFARPYADWETFQDFGEDIFDENCLVQSNEISGCRTCLPETPDDSFLFSNVRKKGGKLISVYRNKVLDGHNGQIVVRIGVSASLYRYLSINFVVDGGRVVGIDACGSSPMAPFTCETTGLDECIGTTLFPATLDSKAQYISLLNATGGIETCTKADGTVIPDPTDHGGARSDNFCFSEEDIDKYNASLLRAANLLAVGGVFLMLYVGMSLESKLLLHSIKRPKTYICLIVGQCFFNPLILFAIAYIAPINDYLLLMAITVAASPGGGGSNALTFISGGTVSTSTSLTIFSTILSVFTMPMWIYVFTSVILDLDVQVPLLPIVLPIFPIVVLTQTGLIIRMLCGGPSAEDTIFIAIKDDKCPFLHSKCSRFRLLSRGFRSIGIPLVLFAIFVLFIDNPVALAALSSLSPTLVLVGIFTQLAGITIGWLVAFLAGLDPIYRRTIAFEVGSQNTLLSLSLIAFTFIDSQAEFAECLPYFVAYTATSPLNIAAALIAGNAFPLKVTDRTLTIQLDRSVAPV